MRAEWIAGVQNIDWPSRQGLSADEQKAELDGLYDEAVDNGLNLWCVSDNLRKGAALNAVQIAELLGRRHLKKG